MSKVSVSKDKLDYLANAISIKSGEPLTLTLDEMVSAVDGMETGGITPTGNINITQAGVTDVTNYATATVPDTSVIDNGINGDFSTISGVKKWNAIAWFDYIRDGMVEGGINYASKTIRYNAVPSGTTITPTTSAQTIGGANYMMEGAVTVSAMPSGTAGTPTATKGTVSNHSVSVTPSVTNSAGYISGGTKTGTAVSVSASELVSGTYIVDSSGTKDVTNYASASVPAGTAGTPALTVSAVENHSKTIRSSVINQTGWITGGTVSGASTTVKASDLVSGSQNITANANNIDVTNLASVNVQVPTGTPSLQTKSKSYTPSTSQQTESVTADNGYDGIDTVNITVNAMPSGSVTAPASITGSSATVSTGTNTLTLSKSVSVTPNVTTAGYVSSGTAGNSSVSLTANVTTKGTATITPTTSNQTIASGTYLTGTQTISGDANLVAGNIKSGTTIFGVTGTYSGGGGTSKNVQVLQSTSRTNSSSLTKVLGDLTVSKTGTYDVYWSGGRTNTSTSYTWGTRLYIDGTGYGTENTSWSNNCQSNHLSNVSLTANQKLSVYARGRTGSYYTFVPMLTIIEV